MMAVISAADEASPSLRADKAMPGLDMLLLAVEIERERQSNSELSSSSSHSDKEASASLLSLSERANSDLEGNDDNADTSGKAKRPWLPKEDELLAEMVRKHGARHWTLIAEKIQGRTGKQARERWLNQLNPDLRKKGWTCEEDRTIIDAHHRYGNKWSAIAKLLNGRTDNSVKNRFNSTLRRICMAEKEAAGAGQMQSQMSSSTSLSSAEDPKTGKNNNAADSNTSHGQYRGGVKRTYPSHKADGPLPPRAFKVRRAL